MINRRRMLRGAAAACGESRAASAITRSLPYWKA